MRQPAIKFLASIFLIVFGMSSLRGQSTLDLLLLEDAEKAYAGGNYQEAVNKAKELLQRGNKGPKILHLKIMATYNNFPTEYSLARELRKDVDFYLENYDNPDFMNLYREVYEVNKWIQANKRLFDDEGFFYTNQGNINYNNKNYTKALELYHYAAEKGNSSAVNIIASMYRGGYGVEKDGPGALEWNTKAALGGDISAQFYMGYCYANGIGVSVNNAEALKWYTMAAEKGNAAAQNNLAILYASGKGTPVNYEKAAGWYTKAAEAGDKYAQINLANILINGKDGVAKDVSKAIDWYAKAANQGSEEACRSLAEHYFQNNYYKEAAYWYEKLLALATKSKFFVYERLGAIYYKGGSGIERDLDKAISYYNKALEEGSDFSLYHLGLAYEEKGDFKKAAQYQKMCVEKKCITDILSLIHLGLYSYEGKGVAKDYKKAAALWTEAKAMKGSALNLAVAYFHGKGVKKDVDYAVALMRDEIKNATQHNNLDTTLEYHQNVSVYQRFPIYAEDEQEFIEYLRKKHSEFFKEI